MMRELSYPLKIRIVCIDWLQRLRQNQVTLRAYLDWFITCLEVRFYPRENSQGFYRLYRKNCKVEKLYLEHQSKFVET